MVFPWRLKLSTQQNSREVLGLLATLTDAKPKTLWYYLSFGGKRFGSVVSNKLFDGHVIPITKSFRLSTFLWPSSGSRTVFHGKIEDGPAQTTVTIWILPGLIPISLFVILASSVIASHVGDYPKLRPAEAWAIAAGLSIVAIPITISIVFRSRNLFNSILSGEIEDLRCRPDFPPWPELPNHFAHRSVRPDYEPEMIPAPDPTLLEHFEHLSRDILAHHSTPPYVLKVDARKEHLSLKFPSRSADGFEVSIDVDNEGTTVFANGSKVFVYPMGEYGGDTFNLIAEVYGVLRTMLSPEFQIRVYSVNGGVMKSQAEVVDKKGKVTPVLDWKVKGKTPSGIKTERVLVNRHMPRPN